MDSPVMAENNVAVAELTEKEAAALGKEDGVLVEEDIVLEGSAAEEGMRDVERAREEMRAEAWNIPRRLTKSWQ